MYDWSHGKVPFGLEIRRLAVKHGIDKCNPVNPSDPPEVAPWLLLKPGVCTDLHSIVHKSMSPPIIKALSLDFLRDKYSHFTHIYTDASKDSSRHRTAGAFWIPDFSIAQVFRLDDNLSVFAAELVAILQALKWVDINNHEAVILTDSLSAVQALESGLNGSRDDIVFEILNLDTSLNSKYIACDIVWVPAHVGLAGNEMIDQFAKKGLEKDSVNLQFRPIPKDYYHHLSKSIGNQWQKLWDEGTSGRHMHTLCPGVKGYSKIRRRKRRDEVILTRL